MNFLFFGISVFIKRGENAEDNRDGKHQRCEEIEAIRRRVANRERNDEHDEEVADRRCQIPQTRNRATHGRRRLRERKFQARRREKHFADR